MSGQIGMLEKNTDKVSRFQAKIIWGKNSGRLFHSRSLDLRLVIANEVIRNLILKKLNQTQTILF